MKIATSACLLLSAQAVQMHVDSHGNGEVLGNGGSGKGNAMDQEQHEEELPEGCFALRGAMTICNKVGDEETCKDLESKCVAHTPNHNLMMKLRPLFAEKEMPEGCTQWHNGFEVCMEIDGKHVHKEVPGRCMISPSSTNLPLPKEAPPGCKVWFDGCNNWAVSPSGKSMSLRLCDRLKCDEPEEAKCALVKGERPKPEVVGDAPAEASNCLHWCDGCNCFDVRGGKLVKNMFQRVKTCTDDEKKEPSCKRPKPKPRPKPTSLGLAPAEAECCVVWFDGCNFVRVDPKGNMFPFWRGEKKECDEGGEAYCKSPRRGCKKEGEEEEEEPEEETEEETEEEPDEEMEDE